MQKGLPLRAVANMADTASSPDTDPSALLAAPGSDITSPKDLEGKRVAVNGLGAVVHVAAAETIAQDGGDPSTVTFVAMPFPDMMGALQQGRIDAASVVEPFATLGESQGAPVIARPYTSAFVEGETMAVLFSAQPFLDTNPDVAERFVRALDRASEEAAENPAEVRRVLVDHGGMNPEIVEDIRFPGFGPQVSAHAIDETARLMMSFGMIPDLIDAEAVVWP